MDGILTVFLSSLIGAVVGFVGSALKSAWDARAKVDESLRSTRIEVYKELWKKTGMLPLYPRSPDITYEKLLNMSEDFRDWYFGQGGIYLSSEARQAYGRVQECITDILKKQSSGNISDDDYQAIQKRCSSLRTELTRDLMSRKRSLLTSWLTRRQPTDK